MAERFVPREESFNLTRGLPTEFGVLKTHVQPQYAHTAINTGVPAEEAAARVARTNTVSHIVKTYGDGEYNPGLMSITPHNDGIVMRSLPTAPYTDATIFVGALGNEYAHRELTPDDDERIFPTQNVYELGFGLQVNYWRTLFHTMEIQKEFFNKNGNSDYTVFAAENCLALRTGEIRTSRSLGAVHGHAIPVNQNRIEEFPVLDDGMKHVKEEQQYLKRIGQSLADRVYIHLPQDKRDELLDTMEVKEDEEKDSINLKIRTRMAMPFGYTMKLPKDTSMEDFTRFMKDHHKAYTATAQELVDRLSDKAKEGIIQQPSYRLYIYREESGEISLIVSPEIISHGGLLEAAGLKLDRADKYKSGLKEGELQGLVNAIQTQEDQAA